MSQMGNDLFTINAPMAPVVDVVMPPLIEGGVSMRAPEYDNSIANYYQNLRNTVKTTADAFKNIVDVSMKLKQMKLQQQIAVGKAAADVINNSRGPDGRIIDIPKDPNGDVDWDALRKELAKKGIYPNLLGDEEGGKKEDSPSQSSEMGPPSPDEGISTFDDPGEATEPHEPTPSPEVPDINVKPQQVSPHSLKGPPASLAETRPVTSGLKKKRNNPWIALYYHEEGLA